MKAINLTDCAFCADKLRKLFTEIRYSTKGSSARMKEEMTFTYFIDYLDDCEGGKVSLILMSLEISSYQSPHQQKRK